MRRTLITLATMAALMGSTAVLPVSAHDPGMFNPAAILDTTQVQDRRADGPSWPMATDTVPLCTEEDGSAPGQPFPCLWDGPTMGNGNGEIYVLTAPGVVLPS